MYQCKCGREFENKQSYVSHCGHCEVHLGHPPKDRFGDARAWARGLTKETNLSLARMSERKKELSKDKIGKPFYHHTDEDRKRLSEIATYNATHHLNGWKAGDNRIPNQYEVATETFLRENNIPYAREVTVSQSLLGGTGPYYQLDFLIDGHIDLEIDGSAHDIDHDRTRDALLSKKYDVYRIQHGDSLKTLDEKLHIFMQTLQ